MHVQHAGSGHHRPERPGGQACPRARAAQLLERGAAPGGGCQSCWSTSVEYLPRFVFSENTEKSSYNWLPFIRGGGVEGGGVYNKVLK